VCVAPTRADRLRGTSSERATLASARDGRGPRVAEFPLPVSVGAQGGLEEVRRAERAKGGA